MPDSSKKIIKQKLSYEPTIEDFNRRYKSAKTLADQWASVLEACFHFAVPFRNRFYRTKESQGELSNKRVYDTTSIEATKIFVSKLHDSMTPPQVQWGFLELDESWFDEQVDQDEFDDAQQMLNKYMRTLFSYIHQSNFDVVINECYFDLAVGTSALVVNQYTEDHPLLFTSIPIDKLSIEEAFNGRIETWFRTWEDIKICEINVRWPKAEIPDGLMSQLDADINAKVKTIKEGVLFYPYLAKPYCYAVWTEEAVLFKEALESNPGIVWRFQKTNNETWGRGPVMDALPSIISLNEMARIELASANLNTFRPYMVFSDGIFNPSTFKLRPFGVIPIAPVGSDGTFPIQPLPEAANPNFAQMTIADLRNQIQRLLYATPGESQSVQPQTATEISVKQQELAQQIGPLFTRLQQEFLWPVIERCAFVLDKMGLLPQPKFNNKKIKFKYKSPLSLAKGMQDIGRVTQFAQVMQGLAGPDETKMYINMAEAPWLMADAMQIDMRYLNTKEGVQAAMEEAKAMMKASMQQEQPEPME